MRTLTALICTGIAGNAFAQVSDDLAGKSLEELLNVPVTLQRRDVTLEDTPAAVYVITPDDIRRMGFASIPEALRMVPGVEVARIDASGWAISARGFNNRFANKLLVLVDGQSVYTPNFSGVFWDAIDLPLEVLDRIEVIRGPGGTLFGPNAVNGIINVITKRAGSDDNVSLQARFGDRVRADGSFVVDADLGEGSGVRVYGKALQHDAYRLFNGTPGHDGWDRNQVGARFDWRGGQGESATLIAGGYRSKMDRQFIVPLFTPPFSELSFDHVEQSAWSVLATYQAETGNAGVGIQVGYDRSNRTIVHAREDRQTLDIDASANIHTERGFDLQAGIGYRTTQDQITGSFLHSYSPTSKNAQRFAAFVQGVWTLSPSTTLVAGSKVLHDEYAGWQLQPSIRVMCKACASEHMWASLTRAIRTPSRADRTVELFVRSDPGPGGLPVFTMLRGASNFQEESLVALEAGYRRRLGDNAHLDAAAYLNFYEGLRTFEPEPIEFRTDPAPHWVLPVRFANKGRASTVGAEVVVRWNVSQSWHLVLGASMKSWRHRLAADSNDVFSELEHFETPRHQLSLQSSLSLGRGWSADAFLAYTDSILSPGVNAYWRFDARVSYRQAAGTEVEFGIRNAFRPGAIEFPLQVGSPPSQIARGLYFGFRRGF